MTTTTAVYIYQIKYSKTISSPLQRRAERRRTYYDDDFPCALMNAGGDGCAVLCAVY